MVIYYTQIISKLVWGYSEAKGATDRENFMIDKLEQWSNTDIRR